MMPGLLNTVESALLLLMAWRLFHLHNLLAHYWRWVLHLGPRLIIKTGFQGMGIPVIKITRSWDGPISIMGIPVLVRRHPYVQTAPTLIKCAHSYVLFCLLWLYPLIIDIFCLSLLGLIRWLHGNRMIASVPVKLPWRIWVKLPNYKPLKTQQRVNRVHAQFLWCITICGAPI